MSNYVIRRLLLAIPTVIIVSIIVFLTIRLIPGNIIDAMIANQTASGGGLNIQHRADIEHTLGLDVPVLTQFGRWVSGIFRGDLGVDMWDKQPVLKEISSKWPVTLELAILALIVSQIAAIPIGIFSSLRQDTWGDYAARSFAIICIAIPSFWLGTMIVVFESIWLKTAPPMQLVSFFSNPLANLKIFIIPAIVLGIGISGGTMRLTRTMMLEVLRQDYIRTAWAKGLRERVVVVRHALKNALIPIITMIGGQLPIVIGGDVIIEQIFNLPGLGRLLIDAVSRRNYTVISGILLIFGVGMVLINILVDISYGFFDPRVSYK